jgi:hypothetical protein
MSFFNDSMVILFWLGVLVSIGVLLTVIVTPLNQAWQSLDIAPEAKTVVSDVDSVTPAVFDWIAVILFIGFPLITMGLAFVNPIPPVFYWLAVALLFVFTLIGFVVTDVWTSVTSDTTIGDAASRMPVIDLVLGNYGIYFMLVWLLVSIGTYVRFGIGGGGAF